MNWSAVLKDKSLWMLLVTNAIIISLFLSGKINLVTLILAYWIQSAIIGFFSFIKVFLLPGEGVMKYISRIFAAWFFIGHFGSFQFFTFIFAFVTAGVQLVQDGMKITPLALLSTVNFGYLVVFTLLLLVSHVYSFVHHRKWHPQGFWSLMLLPYLRVVPMIGALMLSLYYIDSAFIYFITVKVVVDIIMHIVENRKYYAVLSE